MLTMNLANDAVVFARKSIFSIFGAVAADSNECLARRRNSVTSDKCATSSLLFQALTEAGAAQFCFWISLSPFWYLACDKVYLTSLNVQKRARP